MTQIVFIDNVTFLWFKDFVGLMIEKYHRLSVLYIDLM